MASQFGLIGEKTPSRSLGITRKLILVALTVVGSAAVATHAEPSEGSDTLRAYSADNWPINENTTAKRATRCTDCHAFDPLFSHPVDVVPPASMDIPPDLPIIGGRLTCVTCHADSVDSHITGPVTRIGLISGNARKVVSCNQCHNSIGTSALDMHASIAQRAHTSPQDQMRTNAGLSSDDSCLTCHDGAMASDASYGFRGLTLGSQIGTQSGHPVSVEYRVTDATSADGTLTPASMLDTRIRLFDNQVRCTSCHSLFSTEPNLLVMSNDRSQLCLACHQY